MPRVLNRHKDGFPKGSVYIGRPGKKSKPTKWGKYGKWGNPYFPGIDGTLEEIIAMYEQYILGDAERFACLHELKGKDLVCFCAPKPCHGDVLLRLANGLE